MVEPKEDVEADYEESKASHEDSAVRHGDGCGLFRMGEAEVGLTFAALSGGYEQLFKNCNLALLFPRCKTVSFCLSWKDRM